MIRRAPVLVGFGLFGRTMPRWAGVVLLAAFVTARVYLVRATRGQEVLHSHEVGHIPTSVPGIGPMHAGVRFPALR